MARHTRSRGDLRTILFTIWSVFILALDDEQLKGCVNSVRGRHYTQPLGCFWMKTVVDSRSADASIPPKPDRPIATNRLAGAPSGGPRVVVTTPPAANQLCLWPCS